MARAVEAEHTFVPNLAKALLDAGADVNFQDEQDGFTALHTAAYMLHPAAEFLMDNNAGPNIKNKNGEMALHLAAKYSQIETLKALIDFGASINLKDLHRKCVFHHALEGCGEARNHTVEYLLDDIQADTTIIDNKGNNLLHKVFIHNFDNKEFVKRITYHCKPLQKNKEGFTPADLEVEKSFMGLKDCLCCDIPFF